MTIVTYRHRPKRPAKPAQVAEIKAPRIVQHTPRGRAWKLEPLNPEAKARAAEFFAKMGIKRREEGSESSDEFHPRTASVNTLDLYHFHFL